MYKNTHELIEWLKKNNFWTNKNLGQNFLVDLNILKKIVEAAKISETDTIVEVGPGPGILTNALIETNAKVVSIELDDRLIPHLQEIQTKHKNFIVVHADALKTAPPPVEFKVVANIPYYITSPLINHYLQPKNSTDKRPSIMILLVQKEVAQKICSQDGDHSVLSLQVQLYGKPSIVSHVNKNCFFPPPKVDSSILKIEVYDSPIIQNEKLFFRLIKGAFAQRRKTLSNSLRSVMKISKEDLENLLNTCKIKPTTRPQELNLNQWNQIIQTIESLNLTI